LDHNKLMLKDISITPVQDGQGVNPVQAPPPVSGVAPVVPKTSVVISMTLSFPKDMSVEQAARNTLELADKLRKRFPGHTINVVEMVGDLALDRTVSGTSEKVINNQIPNNQDKVNTSRVEIKGALE
jgi:hypothetical protein